MIATKSQYLLHGETFGQKKKSEIERLQLTDKEINEKYRRGEMRIITEQGRINLDTIQTMLESKQGNKQKYILNPEYQRRKRWDTRRKSLLIESFIMNVPIPPIFLYEVEYAVYEVMDGLQRLTAIYDFYRGDYALEGLEYWQELNGKTYKELPKNVKGGIDRRYLSSIILLEETAKSLEEADFLKKIVFERLNSGGEKLKPQETRNALYNGKFNQLCLELAKNEAFRKIWHFPLMSEGEKKLLQSEAYREMKDVELVLRFFAYRHVGKLRTPLDKFLDSYLKHANTYSDETTQELKTIFIDTVELIHEIFGNKALLLPAIEREHKSPRVSVYDAMMQSFSRHLSVKEKLIAKKEHISKEIYIDRSLLYRKKNKNPYLFDGRYNNKKDVIDRIEYYDNFLKNALK